MADEKQQTTLSAIGLVTSPNELAVPQGGLVKAQNCVMLAPGLIGTMQGQAPLTYAPSDDPNEVSFFGDVPIWQTGTDTLEYDTGGEFVSYLGTYEPADATLLRMKFFEAIQNLYFNTTVGCYRLDQYDSTPRLAGVRAALDFTSGAVNSTANINGLAGGASWAYRLVYGTKDAHNTLFLGTPSGRLVVQNTSVPDVAAFGTLTLASASGTVGGTINGTSITTTWATSDTVTAAALAVLINANATLAPLFIATSLFGVVTVTCRVPGTAGNAYTFTKTGTNVTASGAGTLTGGTGGVSYNVALVFPVPSTLTTQDFFQVYRTRQSPAGADADFIDPGDEEFLAFERYFTSLEIAAGTISLVDTTPDDFLGAALYTNEISGEGIGQANATPPYCKDINFWNGVGWYANTKQRQSVTLQILGCGPGDDGFTGIRLGDSVLVSGDTDGIQCIAAEAENLGAGEYKLFLDGDAGSNITRTARSIVNVVTYNDGNLAARYLSTDGGTPGIIEFYVTDLDLGTFDVYVFPKKFDTSLTRVATTVTATTTASHGLVTGDTVRIEPTIGTFTAGTYTITRLSATTFSFTQGSGSAGPTAGFTEQRVTPSASLAWKPSPPPAIFDLPVGALVRTFGTTVTATPTHSILAFLGVGMVVSIQPTTVPESNFPAGTKTVTSVGASTFTYAETGANVASTVAYKSGARVTSDPYRGIAGPSFLSYSKVGQPDAVPLTNFYGVGRTDTPILRIFPQNQSLYVFKDEGVYQVSFTGGDDPYRVDLIDSTVHLYAPDSVVSVSGRVFALTNQGVVAIASGGASILSTPIEQDLFQYFGPTLAATKLQTFASAHETQRLYVLELPALSGASAAPYNVRRAYVFSTIANAWTTWEVERNCGRVRRSDDKFYLGGEDESVVYYQRNTKTAADYAMGYTTRTVTAVNTTTKVLTLTSTSGIAVGDAIVKDVAGGSGSFEPAIVTAVTDSTHLVLSYGPGINVPTAATGLYTLAGVSGTITATIAGHGVPIAVGTLNDALAAILLATTINDDVTVGALVFAQAISATVALTAITAGAAGNAITTTASGTGLTAFHPTLVNGADSSVFAAASIPVELAWRSFVTGAPANEKQWQEMYLHFRERSFYKLTTKFTPNQYPTGATVDLYPGQSVDSPYTVADYTVNAILYPGMPVQPKISTVRSIPEYAQRGAYLNVEIDISEAFAVWTLNGITLIYNDTGNRSGF